MTLSGLVMNHGVYTNDIYLGQSKPPQGAARENNKLPLGKCSVLKWNLKSNTFHWLKTISLINVPE